MRWWGQRAVIDIIQKHDLRNLLDEQKRKIKNRICRRKLLWRSFGVNKGTEARSKKSNWQIHELYGKELQRDFGGKSNGRLKTWKNKKQRAWSSLWKFQHFNYTKNVKNRATERNKGIQFYNYWDWKIFINKRRTDLSVIARPRKIFSPQKCFIRELQVPFRNFFIHSKCNLYCNAHTFQEKEEIIKRWWMKDMYRRRKKYNDSSLLADKISVICHLQILNF